MLRRPLPIRGTAGVRPPGLSPPGRPSLHRKGPPFPWLSQAGWQAGSRVWPASQHCPDSGAPGVVVVGSSWHRKWSSCKAPLLSPQQADLMLPPESPLSEEETLDISELHLDDERDGLCGSGFCVPGQLGEGGPGPRPLAGGPEMTPWPLPPSPGEPGCFLTVYDLRPLRSQGPLFGKGVPVTVRVEGTERYTGGSKVRGGAGGWACVQTLLAT